MDLRTAIEPSIDAFAAGEWERVTRTLGLYASRPYMTLAERLQRDRASYVTCRSGAGELLGALPAYEFSGDELGFYDYRAHVGDPGQRPADRRRWYPGMLGGTRSGYVTDLIVDVALDDDLRTEIARRLLDGFRELAGVRGARSAALIYLTPEAACGLSAALSDDRDEPPLVLSSFAVDADLPLPFASFDDYLLSLPSKRRSGARGEIARYRASGHRTELRRLSDCYGALAPLAAQVHAKYGDRRGVGELTELLELHICVLDEQSRVFVCRDRDARVVGFSLCFVWGDVLYTRAVGFDYDALDRGASVYFNVLFYEPIAYALQRGLRRVHLGVASWAKAARGAAIRPFWSLVVPPDGVEAPWGESVATHNERVSAHWLREYAGSGAELCDDEWAPARDAAPPPASR